MWCGCTGSDIQSPLADECESKLLLVLASFCDTCAPSTQNWLKWLCLPKLIVYFQNKLSTKSQVIKSLFSSRKWGGKKHCSLLCFWSIHSYIFKNTAITASKLYATEHLHLHKYHVSKSIQTNAEWYYHAGKISHNLFLQFHKFFRQGQF